MGLSLDEKTDRMIRQKLSGFSQDGANLFQRFMETFAEGVSLSDMPLDFVVEQLSLIPQRYARLQTVDPDRVPSSRTEIFTPSGLVDHLALLHYTKFNLFDLLDDETGYTILEIDGERYVFALMRNKPVSSLTSEEEKARFEYRLTVWNGDGELVGFRDHYVDENSLITQYGPYTAAVKGIGREIEVGLWGKSKNLGLTFKKPLGEDNNPVSDEIWIHQSYRRRHIGRTLENIGTGFVPGEILDIGYVIAQPKGPMRIIMESPIGYLGHLFLSPPPDIKAQRDFLWEAGYEDDLSNDGTMVKRFLRRCFPRIEMLPKNRQTISQRPQGQNQAINPDYSPTWQYARLLSLEKR